MCQAQGGLADPNRGNAAHRRSPRAHGATLRDRAGAALRDAGGGEIEVVDRRRDLSNRAGRPGRRRLDQRAARLVRPAAATDRDQGAGHLLRLPGSGGLRARPIPGLDLDGRAVVLRLPDLRRGRPEGRRGLRRPGGGPGPTDVRTRRGRVRAREAFMAARLPGAVGPPIYTKTCLYTLTPDRDFVVDRLPDHPGVVVVLGAGHGFKFASVLGRIAAELSVDGVTPSAGELDAFRIDRPILLEKDPPTRGWCRRPRPARTVRAERLRGTRDPVATYREARARRAPLEEDRCDRPCALGGPAPGCALGLVGGPASSRPRRPVGRRRSGRPAGRDDPGPRLDEPVRHGARRRLRGLHAQLRPAGRLRPGPRAVPGFAESWSAPPTATPGRSRSGGDEVVGRHAGDRRGCLLVVPDRPRRDRADSTSASATSTRTSRTPASPRSSAPTPRR